MGEKTQNKKKNKGWKKRSLFYLGIFCTVLCVWGISGVSKYTSTNEYCISCHVHEANDMRWKFSSHFNNQTGMVTNCVDCHLPPKEDGVMSYYYAKATHGFKDLYGFYMKDSADFQWNIKSHPDVAKDFVYDESCKKCHQNMYPATLSRGGCEAHMRYEKDAENKSCISCHISVGHYDPNAHGHNANIAQMETKEVFNEPAKLKKFENFTEQIPGTSVSFNMKAIPGGAFKMGSSSKDDYVRKNELPKREVKINDFWMAEIEVTWDEYLAFFSATASQGRKKQSELMDVHSVDGISGPTPPWGAPDQGWGKDDRPAITMSHYAATVYCKWLSLATGKNYRLPTEAEWEYAARGGTEGPYFFDGEPQQFTDDSFWNKMFGPDTTVINSYVVYKENSPMMTQEPDRSQANPFGLKNMLGNVAEFCLDYYDPKIYGKYPKGQISNPFGPRNGAEHVVRGGSFMNASPELRIARRDFTRTKQWLKTDPQIPKSIWWYSDCKHVGFRVVCTTKGAFEENTASSGASNVAQVSAE